MSKTILFYFSGTGNSLAVARNIASRLPDAVVVPMLQGNPKAFIESGTESIGLIYPIYMNAIPRLVKNFIKGLEGITKLYVFAIATHGGLPGMAGLNLAKALKKHHLPLDAYFEIEMINNTPKGVAPKPLMRLNWEREITQEIVDAKLKAAEISISDAALCILRKDRIPIENPSSPKEKANYAIMSLMWRISENSRPKLQFLLDETCSGCGICESVCLSNRISMVDGKPAWIHEDCHYCYACFNYCPEQAIGVKYYTKKLGRYHHPQVKVEDIISQK